MVGPKHDLGCENIKNILQFFPVFKIIWKNCCEIQKKLPIKFQQTPFPIKIIQGYDDRKIVPNKKSCTRSFLKKIQIIKKWALIMVKQTRFTQNLKIKPPWSAYRKKIHLAVWFIARRCAKNFSHKRFVNCWY